MRRLTVVAIAGLLTLTACSNDNTAPTPTEPAPEAAIARCRPTPFPVADLTKQIIKIFPVTGGLQAKALVSEVAIGALWTVCKPIDAQKGVAAFVKWMVQQFQATKLIDGKSDASSLRVRGLTNSLYSAVGLTPPNFPPEVVGDGNNFGNGLFVPGGTQPVIIKTGNSEGGTSIPPNGFTEPTLITIFKRPDSPSPFPPGVVAPFYEITASNASGTHSLANGQSAVVGFCVDDALLAPPHTPAIAHLLNGVVEILDPADTGPLGLDCVPFVTPEPFVVGAAGFGSLRDLALSGMRTARQQVSAIAQALFMPSPLQAAVAATGKSGLGGLARSLSPFGVTDRQISPLSCDLESNEGGIRSLNSDTPVNVTFVNNTSQSVSVFWLNFDGLRQYPFPPSGGFGQPYAVLAPGQSYVQATFVTHPWILIGDAGGESETCYGIFLPLPFGGTVAVPTPVVIP